MAVSSGQTTALEMKTRLREKPLSELTEEFEQLSSTSDCDVDLLCAYLEVLEEKAPVLPAEYDPAAEYEKFKENHAELFEASEVKKPAPRKGALFRIKQVLVAFAAVFCLVVLVADANGAGVIGRLIEWGTEVFSLRPASGAMELGAVDENGFRSLQDALDSCEVKDVAIPTWIPTRYSINKIAIFETNDITTVSAKYVSDGETLFIRATISSQEAFTFEEDATDEHTLYTTHGNTFILSANLDQERAVWSVNGYAYSVSGNVTESEMKQMLDSIQIKE